MKEFLKIGIIGLSKGNGHPYSWSAIINGEYDEEAMEHCGYAGIPLYLKANKDTLGIDGATVTHVYTQDRELSEHIAKASCIENIAEKPEDMIGRVDAVILARDDPENHVAMARPFLDAGVPIFIDKPLAYSHEDLIYFKEQHRQGKLLMSCSSMRYAVEIREAKKAMESMGAIELATVVGVKDWPKYGVHMLEALFALLDDPKAVSVQHLGREGKDIVSVMFETDLQATVHIYMDIAPVFQISLYGRKGWRLIDINDSYAMFRENLKEFIKSVRDGKPRLEFEKTENIIRTLIGAGKSLANGGKKVLL